MESVSAQRGFTAIELVAALAIGGMILAVAIPAFSSIIDRSRLDGATRQLTSDLWNAHSKAITTGWEYKLVGFGNASSNLRRNQYRLMGRQSSAVAWPLDTDAPFASTTKSAGPWTNLTTLDYGLQMLPGGSGADARFEIAFNARGAVSVNTGDFAPFQLVVKARSRLIRVSSVGGVTTQ